MESSGSFLADRSGFVPPTSRKPLEAPHFVEHCGAILRLKGKDSPRKRMEAVQLTEEEAQNALEGAFKVIELH